MYVKYENVKLTKHSEYATAKKAKLPKVQHNHAALQLVNIKENIFTHMSGSVIPDVEMADGIGGSDLPREFDLPNTATEGRVR